MEEESNILQMDQSMKDTGNLIKLMEEEGLFIQMVILMMGNGKIIVQMVMAFFMNLMVLSIKESGCKIKRL